MLIVDFKTNRSVPATLAEVPLGYVRQLALYAALLARLYPGRPVRAAFVWTAGPSLMDVPRPDLEEALEQGLGETSHRSMEHLDIEGASAGE